jgi:hypothetical protein
VSGALSDMLIRYLKQRRPIRGAHSPDHIPKRPTRVLVAVYYCTQATAAIPLRSDRVGRAIKGQ